MMGGPGGPRGLLDRDVLKPQSTGITLARLAQHFKPFWFAMLAAAVFVVISTWTQVTTPELMGELVDCYLSPAAASAFANFPGAPQAENASLSNCWLAQGHVPENPTQLIVTNAFQLGGFPLAPADPSQMTQDERIAGLGRLIALMIILFVAGALLTGLTFFSMSWSGQHVLRALRVEVFEHLHRLPIAYYAVNEADDLKNLITNDT